MSANPNSLPYRLCVGIVLFNPQGLVFVGERIDTQGAWQMPQGGIDEGEDIVSAALRELGEEVGTNKADIIHIAKETVRYDFPPELSIQNLTNRYRGQEQTWVAMRFLGEDTDIRLDAHDPAEFSRWQWVELSRTVDLIVPFKRETYRQVISLFQDITI